MWSRLGCNGHDVSILIATIGPVGRCRGVEPRSKVSMMIMRPPQHGHGCASVAGSSGSVPSASLRGRREEQLACPRDVLGARGAGEETVVADAVEASWQDVDEEAADELARGERHDLVAGAAGGSIVLVFEGDALLVERDQPAVGDGDAVGVAIDKRAWPWVRRTEACCRRTIRSCAVAPDRP